MRKVVLQSKLRSKVIILYIGPKVVLIDPTSRNCVQLWGKLSKSLTVFKNTVRTYM